MDNFTPFLEGFGAGLVGVLIPLAGGTPAVLRHFGGTIAFHGRWRPYSPNWITLWSLIFSFAGIAFYFTGHPTLGIGIGGFGGMLDRLDGRMAHVLNANLDPPRKWTIRDGSWWARVTRPSDGGQSVETCKDSRWARFLMEMNFRGGTDLGKVLDPACDKMKTFALLALFVHAGTMSLPIVAVLAVPELFGTLMRRPFYLFEKSQGESKASAVGKWKAMLQWIAVIIAVPFHQGWMSDGWTITQQWWLVNGPLAFSILLALGSVVSRFKAARQGLIGWFLNKLEKPLSHE